MMQPDTPDQGGFTIEFKIGGDGSIQVCSETGDQESQESGGDDSDMSKYVSAKSIDEACSIAKQIFQNNGQMPSQDDGMADAQKGYDRRAGSRMMGGDGSGEAIFGE